MILGTYEHWKKKRRYYAFMFFTLDDTLTGRREAMVLYYAMDAEGSGVEGCTVERFTSMVADGVPRFRLIEEGKNEKG